MRNLCRACRVAERDLNRPRKDRNERIAKWLGWTKVKDHWRAPSNGRRYPEAPRYDADPRLAFVLFQAMEGARLSFRETLWRCEAVDVPECRGPTPAAVIAHAFELYIGGGGQE